MIKNHLLGIAVAAVLFLAGQAAKAQGLSVNNTGATANTTAMLDVSSTSQGMLIPRLTTTQRTGISSPATSLIVYQTDGTPGFYYYTGSAWVSLNASNTTAGGDLTGTYPNPTLSTISGVAGTYPSGSIPGDISFPEITVDSKGRVTSGATVNVAVIYPGTTAGGNLTGTYPNPTIASLPAISGASLTSLTPANLTSGGTFPAENGSNLTNLNASNISSGTVPTANLGSGTANSSTFLRGDGSWQAISGGSVSSVSAGNLSPLFTTSVSNATTTPNISYTLSTAGAYSVLTNSTSSTSVPTYTKVHPLALLNTGGTASSSTYYRGDGQWATPSGGSSSAIDLVANVNSSLSISGGSIGSRNSFSFNNTVTSPSVGSWNGTTYTAGATGLYLIVFHLAVATTGNGNMFTYIEAGGNFYYSSGGGSTNNAAPEEMSECVALVYLTSSSTVICGYQFGSNNSSLAVTTDGSSNVTIMKF